MRRPALPQAYFISKNFGMIGTSVSSAAFPP